MHDASSLPHGRAWSPPSPSTAVNATASPTELVAAVAGRRHRVTLDLTANAGGTFTVETIVDGVARAIVGPVPCAANAQYAYDVEGDDDGSISLSFTTATQVGGTERHQTG